MSKSIPLSLGNGQVREVNAHTEADRLLMDTVWATYYAGERVLALAVEVAR